MVALVVATYGLPASGLYEMIWRDCVWLWRELPRVREYRMIQTAQGVAFGIGLSFDDKDKPTTRALSEMERRVLHG